MYYQYILKRNCQSLQTVELYNKVILFLMSSIPLLQQLPMDGIFVHWDDSFKQDLCPLNYNRFSSLLLKFLIFKSALTQDYTLLKCLILCLVQLGLEIRSLCIKSCSSPTGLSRFINLKDYFFGKKCLNRHTSWLILSKC